MYPPLPLACVTPRLHASPALWLPRQPAQGSDPAPLLGTVGPALRATPTQPKACGLVDARGHGARPHAVSTLWRETTRTAPSAPPVSTRCQPRDACGGAALRLIMSPRGLPR